MQFEIRAIPATELLALRQRVLRPHQPVSGVVFEGDEAPTTFHLGAFIGAELCSIATYIKQAAPDGADPEAWRLRGMATDPEWRGRGLGGALVEEGLRRLAAAGATRLWFNARTSAAGFYARFGFEQLGEIFELPQIGPHVVMHRAL